MRVVDTLESWDWWGYCWGHVLKGAGVTAADRVFLPFSFGPFIGFWAAVEGARRVNAMMIPRGGWDSIQRPPMMRALVATVVCFPPTHTLRVGGTRPRDTFCLPI